jgi:hypothetical protein
VYFIARGQLIPGQGNTYTQNLQGSGSASIYRWHEGHLEYVAPLEAIDLNENSSANHQGALIRRPRVWVAQTTDNGNYLFFVSRANITGANPGGVAAAYLYSAPSESLDCVSCPPDGSAPQTHSAEPSLTELITRQIDEGEAMDNYHPRSLSEDGRAAFTSYEALTPGAVENRPNVYEWYRGQLSLLTTGKAKFQDMGGPNGRDLFISSYERLAPQDSDSTSDLYDFRAGGGFPAPVAPPAPCEPGTGQCQGAPGTPPGAPAPSTPAFSGPGNPPVSVQKQKKKAHKKKQHKKKKAHKKSRRHQRAANSNRGGAK